MRTTKQMNETNVRKWAKSLRQFSRDSSSQVSHFQLILDEICFFSN